MADEFVNKVDQTLQEEPIVFDITVDKPDIFHKIGLKKRKRKFVIDPPPLRVLSLISKHISNIDFKEEEFEEVRENGNIFDLIRKSIPHLEGNNYEEIIKVLVVAVTRKEPSRNMINYFSNNIKPKELYNLITMLIQRFDLSFFLLSLACIKGMNVYRTKDSTRSNLSEEQSEQGTQEKKS